MKYVLDSFAVLVGYWKEPGAERLRQLRDDPHNQFWMSVINLGEVFYKIARAEGEFAARRVTRQLIAEPITIIDVDQVLALAAASIKARFALAYADCYAAALARQVQAAVISGDREFQPLEKEGVVVMEWLPAKHKSSS